jgi:hypothetical protein
MPAAYPITLSVQVSGFAGSAAPDELFEEQMIYDWCGD